jgi:hypothetical protein
MNNNLGIESRQLKLKVHGLIRRNYTFRSQYGKKLRELISLGT